MRNKYQLVSLFVLRCFCDLGEEGNQEKNLGKKLKYADDTQY